MWAQQEQRSPRRIVSGVGSLKSPGNQEAGLERGGPIFSPRLHQRACQVPSTRHGGDALRFTQQNSSCISNPTTNHLQKNRIEH